MTQVLADLPATAPEAHQLEDFESAIRLLLEASNRDDIGSLGAQILANAARHLVEKADRYLTGRPRLDTTDQARAILERAAGEIRFASQALRQCAEQLKAASKHSHASDAYKAHLRLLASLEDLGA